MERYTMHHRKETVALSNCFLTPLPHLAHLQRVFAQDYGCLRAPHAHTDTVELVLITQGRGVFSINGVKVPVRRGHLAIYNSGIVHEEQFAQAENLNCFSCSIYNVHRTGLREDALIADDMFPRFDTGNRFNSVERLIEMMFQECSSPLPHSETTVQALLMALLSLVMDITEQPQLDLPLQNSDSLLCQEVKQFIDRHFREELNLQDIADAVHISVSHMSHVFKNRMGYSPLQYIVYRRIGEAQTLLETTNLSVTNIGMEVGFPNPSYFNAVFNKKCGMTPLKYRAIYAYDKDRKEQ